MESDVRPPASTGAAQGVGLLIKAFQILDLFTEERRGWTQAELVRETALARSTLSRLVRFLVGRGYLMEDGGRYSLGFAAVDLGRRAQTQFSLVDLFTDLLEELAQLTAETVILTGYDEAQGRIVCLAQIPSRHGGLRVFENVGATFPLHSGATAKAILAFLPEAQIEAVLAGDIRPVNPLAPPRAADRLRAELETIRTNGYTISHDETYAGVTGIGAPLLTASGRPLGSIAVAVPTQRMDERITATYVEHVQALSKAARLRLSGGQL